MLEIKKWMASADMAEWLLCRPQLDIREQIDCVLSAPHRTFAEKLEGLRTLRDEAGDSQILEEQIEWGEYLEKQVYFTRRMFHELYEADIFYHGQREWMTGKRIFRAPVTGIEWIKKQILERATQCGTKPEEYFGALYGFRDKTTKRLDHRWSFITNYEGEVVYCFSEYQDKKEEENLMFGITDSHYLRLPYASGTLVEMTENPFFPSLKGILLNEKEPWEADFAKADQWLLVEERLHREFSAGIDIIPLDDYTSITFGLDFLLPFRQFLHKYKGECAENERWLWTLGKLVKKDKRCAAFIAKDSLPKGESAYGKKCQRYVEDLMKRMDSGKAWEQQCGQRG